MSQKEFSEALLDAEHSIPEDMVDPKGRPAGKRFNVYRNNVVSSLSDALADAYPVVQKLVGEKFFQAMAGVFVRQHPPQSPILFRFAAEFPDFLETFPPVAKLAYLPDVARLERARTRSYHAANADPIDGATLAALSPEQMATARFTLHPSLQIISSAYPVLAIWQKNMESPDTEIPPNGQDVLIARPNSQVELHLLPAGAVGFLRSLDAGTSLGDTIEACAKAPGFDLTENLGGLFAAQILIKITTEG